MGNTASDHLPLVLGVGGTTRPHSSSERLLRAVLRSCEQQGTRTALFAGPFLAELPHYAPERHQRTTGARELLATTREANGLVIASPSYHGGMSGLVKNALDYFEDLRDDPTPYLTGRAVACVTTGAGWQGANASLTALRMTVHALRGWPTPLGAAVNTCRCPIPVDGAVDDPHLSAQLDEIAASIVAFVHRHVREQQVA